MANEPKQTLPIPELDSERGAFEIELSTRKYGNGQIVSAAHGQRVKDGMVTFMLYGDFRQVYARNAGRATQAALNSQHAATFSPAQIEAIRHEAIAFYAAQQARAA
jgi:hypothetical protein